MEKLKELGYIEIKETKTYIEFKTAKYCPYERIKILKDTLDICKDCVTGQGNRGHRNILYKELQGINEVIALMLNDPIRSK